MRRLTENISSIIPVFADQVELLTLLAKKVENIYAVSNLKHEPFGTLNYAEDFTSILKESIKRTTNSKLGLHSRKVTYCPMPKTFMALSAPCRTIM